MIVRELINLIGFRINEGQFRSVESRINKIQQRMLTFGTRATLFMTAPFVGLNIWMGKTLSEFEQLDVAFQTMIGSTEKANKLVEDMLQFAAETPFEVKNIGQVAKQLLAVGIETEEVINTLKSLGDVSAGLSVPISRLALNYGQVKAQAKLTGRELRDFAVAGVPLTAELGKMLGKTTAEIQAMVSKGAIGFPEVRDAFKRMSSDGGKFANLMIKQAKTLGGMWSNFQDIIALTVRDFSKDLLPMFKKIVLGLIRIVDTFKRLSPTMKRIIWFFGLFLALLGPVTLALWAFVTVGKAVTAGLLAIFTAARLANMNVLLFLGKFVLITVAILAAIGLAVIAFEDVFTFMKGGESATGRIIALLDKLNEKLKAIGVFTLNFLKRIFGNVSDIIDGFFETIIGTFTGRWKFALDGIIKFFVSALKLIANTTLIVFQPVLDIINTIFKTKFDLGKIMDDLIEVGKKAPGIFGKGFGAGKDLLEKAVTSSHAALGGVLFGDITGGMSPGGGDTFNINSNITLPIKEGTPAAQVEDLDRTARAAVKAQFQEEIRHLANSMPERE